MERFALIFFTLTAPNVSAIISKNTWFFYEIFRGCLLGPEDKIKWGHNLWAQFVYRGQLFV